MPGYTREDLKRLQAMSLDDKIEHSISMIEIFYMRERGGCYYSFSGGKDSTVLKSIMEIDYTSITRGKTPAATHGSLYRAQARNISPAAFSAQELR